MKIDKVVILLGVLHFYTTSQKRITSLVTHVFVCILFWVGDKGREGGQQNSREFDPLQNSGDKDKNNSDDKGKINKKCISVYKSSIKLIIMTNNIQSVKWKKLISVVETEQ